MGNFSATLLVFVLVIIAITMTILVLAVLREILFWYWRSKGVLSQPNDVLNKNHETALFIRKSIAGLKAADLAAQKGSVKPLSNDIPA